MCKICLLLDCKVHSHCISSSHLCKLNTGSQLVSTLVVISQITIIRSATKNQIFDEHRLTLISQQINVKTNCTYDSAQ